MNQGSGTGRQIRILVVEDDEPLLFAFRDTLIRSGYRVDIAATASHAIDLIDSHGYELVVTDLQLPGQGTSVIDHCNTRRIPTIVVTGRDREGLRESMLKRGAAAYLTKPVQASALRRSIEETIRGR